MKINYKKIIIGTVVSIFIIVILFRNLDFEKLKEIDLSINYFLLFLALLLSITATFFRSLRFKISLKNEISLKSILSKTLFYNFYTRFFPGGIGELSFVYMLRKSVERGSVRSVNSLMITRLYDLLTITIFLLAGFGFNQLNTDETNVYLIFFIVIAMLFGCVILFLDRIISLFEKIFRKSKSKIGKRIYVLVGELKNESLHNKKNKYLMFGYSVLFWAINYLMVYVFCHSINMQISYFDAIIVSSFSIITGLIPINTLGGFGYKEGGLTLALIFIGFIKQDAIIYAFLIHLVSLFLALLSAGVGLIIEMINKIKKNEEYIKEI
jgi:uncharacterized protein (TIRG00374 family)